MSNPTESPATPLPPVGLRCWNCGHRELRVVYTRHRPDEVQRRRECRRCGKRFTTWERMLHRFSN
jgi:transcriptional regulator NrdR family protein